MKKIIVGLTGASGVVYGIRLLDIVRSSNLFEIHLIISESAKKVISLETNCPLNQIEEKADFVYSNQDQSSVISSGSFITSGMIVVPCSIKTLSGIENSYNDCLIVRAADVVLKEKRNLVLCVRETPFHLGHIKLMEELLKRGAVVFPLIPSFYNKPNCISDIVDQTVYRILDQIGIFLENSIRYKG
ncbi:UbiX family flavin prenyltransferase [Candidatus Riesia pediculicola]|uniref:Flavin prenyltransferase UbiX n=1 Tax=Riesia pediculicola (strain USDA) TaxID=515618 RepID=D4G8T6_RIEPU|nr:UbiX family flavin prenyltransferase [Candidatus Riesia pediculicola]ADD79421.1 3-octaprenyl-4-hydroxybenzoate carboxy-lyase [Candidatus Riesia pediculicola USDA]ARC53953.1 3-octaprenyl-4-hydroxybenzoate carboxy-lyase [Candidatus Riesia pediculicola]ARC54386.1 3-octaprenyl-4-hydroxybenzoate carboxy-lyase [Candidatus Riesia pediculicola]QOJ86581.1 UbiX family flavin prenyltransferase [Candidatus Riesia pediculicola]